MKFGLFISLVAILILASCSNYHSRIRYSKGQPEKEQDIAKYQEITELQIHEELSTVDSSLHEKAKLETEVSNSNNSNVFEDDLIYNSNTTIEENSDHVEQTYESKPTTDYPGGKNKRNKKNRYLALAIVGLILSLVPILHFVGLILDIIALVKGKQTDSRGTVTVAIIALIAFVVIGMLLFISLMSFGT